MGDPLLILFSLSLSLSLQATCALYEIMSAPESGAAVLGLYPPLFVTLLLRVSCTVGVQLPKNLQSRERRSSSHGPAPRSLHPCRYGTAGAEGTRPPATWDLWCLHKHDGVCRGRGWGWVITPRPQRLSPASPASGVVWALSLGFWCVFSGKTRTLNWDH